MSDIEFIPVKHIYDIRKIIPKHQMAFFISKSRDKILDENGSVLYFAYTLQDLRRLKEDLEEDLIKEDLPYIREITREFIETIDKLISIYEEEDAYGMYIPTRHYR